LFQSLIKPDTFSRHLFLALFTFFLFEQRVIPVRTETLIVGGGLCGLHTASELTKRGADFMLLEARDRLGGRILSRMFGGSSGEHERPGFDLGPAWFWPGQALMESLIDELGLSSQIFTQYASGEGIYEDEQSAGKRWQVYFWTKQINLTPFPSSQHSPVSGVTATILWLKLLVGPWPERKAW
jgi:hypothetical protein